MSYPSTGWSGICSLADFDDPRFVELAAQIDPRRATFPPHRKLWEWTRGAMFLRERGILDGRSRVLDVGAGTEPILFWLAGQVGSVTAVDVYGDGVFREHEATDAFLHRPEDFAPYPYPVERLTVLKQDARALGFEDASFDAVVSFSSIEHFGGHDGARRAAREIGRVLRPGGVAFIATELLLHIGVLDCVLLLRLKRAVDARLGRGGRYRPLRPSGDVFTAQELEASIVALSGLRLVDPLVLDRAAVAAARRLALPIVSARDDELHVALTSRGSVFTSVALALEKPL
jgi:SAM-dependent methyltransferase